MYIHKNRLTRQVWMTTQVPLPLGSSTQAGDIKDILIEAKLEVQNSNYTGRMDEEKEEEM